MALNPLGLIGGLGRRSMIARINQTTAHHYSQTSGIQGSGASSADASPDPAAPRTFQELAQDLQRQARELVAAEAIAPVAAHMRPRAPAPPAAAPAVPTSRRNTRAVFDDDPLFPFARKRGKRLVMLRRKLDRRFPAAALSIALPDELNLASRSQGRLRALAIAAPPPPPTPPAHGDQTKPIHQFIDNCLGPLVWANAEVDISLVYDKDAGEGRLSFGLCSDADPDLSSSAKDLVLKHVDLAALAPSDILQMILNPPAADP